MTDLFTRVQGCEYRGHYYSQKYSEILCLDDSLNKNYPVLSESGIEYVGSLVKNPLWEGKFGIFLERFQSYFFRFYRNLW